MKIFTPFFRLQAALGVTSSLLFSFTASAGTWDSPVEHLRRIQHAGKSSAKIYQHPLQKLKQGSAAAFRLILDGNQNLDQALLNELRGHILNPLLNIRNVRTRPGFGLDGSSFSHDYEFFVNGVAVCNYQLRAHKLYGIKDPVLIGRVPDVDVYNIPDKQDWPDANFSHEQARNSLLDAGISAHDSQIIDRKRCLFVREHSLVPSWDLIIEANDLPYRAIVNEYEALEVNPSFFDLSTSGTAKAYEKNPSDGVLKTFQLSNLVGNSKLENDHFTTSTSGTSATESDHNFIYDPSDARFDEVSLFVHANLQYDWFRSHGHSWSGNDKLNIVAHAVIGGSINNALYTPASGSRPPRIQVGDGDGIRLANLPKDGDVVSHELGHHIVYDTLQSVQGESLVLHEGLADFFTFARTGDPCLGESICPAGSPIGCERKGQCLRAADNTYTLNEVSKLEPHFKSQFISGMLWELRSSKIPSSDLDAIVFRAIQLLQQQSGYYDFILALLLADQELYQSGYCQTIYDTASARGLSDQISNLSCASESLPQLTETTSNSGTTSETTTERKESEDNILPWCGIAANASAGTLWISLLFFLAPLLGLLRRKP